MKENYFIGVVFLSMLIVGCESNDGGLSDEKYLVNKGKVMKLQEYGATNIMKTLIRDTQITMSLGEKQIVGLGGCNLYKATMVMEDNKIQINDLVSNEMFCQTPKGVMVQEEDFLNILDNATKFDEVDNKFTIRSTESRVLIFQIIN